ncbi:BTE_HP_G0039300.mRNA.1.CDS.1 [Saccharomyces cerevisiae]|nr:BTE_HP_G0039300.mRNA.1.CDS.1 [Saccharomyces cerevisiae]CAI6789366.1 BTE_HP_G0039300.mRNA.1.CDS.1 [Saccharomyces cerevisiae]
MKKGGVVRRGEFRVDLPWGPFITSSKDFDHLELRIAPELWLKRLIISGLQKYQEMEGLFQEAEALIPPIMLSFPL